MFDIRFQKNIKKIMTIKTPSKNEIIEFMESKDRPTLINFAHIFDLHFEDIDFSDVVFNCCRFVNVKFEECDLTGSNFYNSVIDRCVLNNVRGSSMKFDNSAIFDSKIERSNISGSEFNDCYILDSSFSNSILTDVDFSRTRGLKIVNTKFSSSVITNKNAEFICVNKLVENGEIC